MTPFAWFPRLQKHVPACNEVPSDANSDPPAPNAIAESNSMFVQSSVRWFSHMGPMESQYVLALNIKLISIIPTLLDSLPHPLRILLAIILVQITRLDVRRTARIRIIQQALNTRQDGRHIVRR